MVFRCHPLDRYKTHTSLLGDMIEDNMKHCSLLAGFCWSVLSALPITLPLFSFQGRGCYSTFGWVPSIASLIILLQLFLSLVIFSNVIIICSGLSLERFS